MHYVSNNTSGWPSYAQKVHIQSMYVCYTVLVILM